MEKEKLHKQIHNITELSNILTTLVNNPALFDTDVTRELFIRYVTAVQDHLKKTDAALYAELLDHSSAHKHKVVNLFISGSKEIKRIFSDYTKKWCDQPKYRLRMSNYGQFQAETMEMFDLVLRRLQDETERLYPLIGDYDKTDNAA